MKQILLLLQQFLKLKHNFLKKNNSIKFTYGSHRNLAHIETNTSIITVHYFYKTLFCVKLRENYCVKKHYRDVMSRDSFHY